jgi:hypothetical protein
MTICSEALRTKVRQVIGTVRAASISMDTTSTLRSLICVQNPAPDPRIMGLSSSQSWRQLADRALIPSTACVTFGGSILVTDQNKQV